MQTKVLRLDPRDNIWIALTNLAKGETVSIAGESCTLVTDVSGKHKFAVKDFAPGDHVIMYGVVVGKAVVPIQPGETITTRNMRHDAASYNEHREPHKWQPPDVSAWRDKTFLGYHRADGQVGTRNYWIVLPLVFCENRNVDRMREALEEELGYGASHNSYRSHVRQLVQHQAS